MPKKVIVAVHGIGEPIRYATIRQVLSQFCQYHDEVASVPLGNFHVQNVNALNLTSSRPAYPQELQDLAFAEVYWADIAREVVARKFDLEDIEPWVQTIVGRIRRRKLANGGDLDTKDQRMLEEVLGEMLQTVDVLDRLLFLTKKMGLFSFDLKKVLTDFIGDVQIVADFKSEGKRVGDKFSDLLDKVHKDHPGAEIYLVAHSEGTVVTLLGLLSALCDPAAESSWIKNVRGLMTLGSPIDKHLILWPELFEAFGSPRVEQKPVKAIEWRNYYDHGDPVGFELDTARARFTKGPWKGIFNFSENDDHGFTRYYFPGKAHVDYWTDAEVFGHFIQTVVYKDEKLKPKPEGKSYEKAPATKMRAWAVSWMAPYLGAAALLFCGVYVLYKAVLAYEGASPGVREILGAVGSFTLLLAGVTVAARIPRLTRIKKWHGIGFSVFVLSLLAYPAFPCLVNPAAGGFQTCYQTKLGDLSAHYNLLGGAVLVLVMSFVLRKALPAWGMRTLLVPGVIAIAYVIFRDIKDPQGDLWPVFLAGAFLLYIWWLVALVFDLVFVWHRYIRYSKEGRYLWDRSTSTGKAPSPAAPVVPTAATT
jgi:hypothetical protein